jgi:hypothetical protein
MSGLILETETESITFGEDGRLLHTHKTTFAQRRSLNTWPDFRAPAQQHTQRLLAGARAEPTPPSRRRT